MMKFSNVFLEYTKFMKENSKYNLDITKDYIVGTTHFPTIEFKYIILNFFTPCKVLFITLNIPARTFTTAKYLRISGPYLLAP